MIISSRRITELIDTFNSLKDYQLKRMWYVRGFFFNTYYFEVVKFSKRLVIPVGKPILKNQRTLLIPVGKGILKNQRTLLIPVGKPISKLPSLIIPVGKPISK